MPLPELEPAFPGLDGRGVRVAVVDSGVNPRHPHIHSVAGGVTINSDGVIESRDYLDLLGHGTAVTAAIQEKAPAATYFAVRIFQNSLRTSSLALLRAVEWSLENQAHVINLSLGTLNSARAEEFRTLANRCPALVAAQEANSAPCYPGCLTEVFGVALDETISRNQYGVKGRVYLAAGYPRPAPGVPVERNLQGISFAVANMSGFIARALQQSPPEHLREILLAEAQRLQVKASADTQQCP